MATFSPCPTSATLRLRKASCTADLTSTRARPKNRWRLLRLFPFGLARRSTMFMFIGLVLRPTRRCLAGLVHTHVPFDKATHLALGIAAIDHAIDEVGVLLLGLRVPLAAEADDRQQILDLAEHAPLDDLAQFLVRGPGRVAPAIRGPRPQREFDYLVAEILRVGDAGRLFDLREFLVQQLPVHQLPGIGVLVVRV